MKTWRVKMQKVYEEILELEPTYKEIEAFVDKYDKYYGVVTYTKRDDNPLSIRLHDT